VDGRVGPRTEVSVTSERRVLDHCTGTRRVVFGVGNAWSLFKEMTGGLEMFVLDGSNTRSLTNKLFVPDTNPPRGPRSSFVDGG
jgi:hypothetical protein